MPDEEDGPIGGLENGDLPYMQDDEEIQVTSIKKVSVTGEVCGCGARSVLKKKYKVAFSSIQDDDDIQVTSIKKVSVTVEICAYQHRSVFSIYFHRRYLTTSQNT